MAEIAALGHRLDLQHWSAGITAHDITYPKRRAHLVDPPSWQFLQGSDSRRYIPSIMSTLSSPNYPFETPQIPSNRGHEALNRGTWGVLGSQACLEPAPRDLEAPLFLGDCWGLVGGYQGPLGDNRSLLEVLGFGAGGLLPIYGSLCP